MVEIKVDSVDREAWHEAMLSRMLVLENVPQAGPEKYEKLKDVLTTIVKKSGDVVEDGVTLPKTEEGAAKGFAFLQFETKESAMKAQRKLDKYPMDRNHVLICTSLLEIRRLAMCEDKFDVSTLPLPETELTEKDIVELPAWLRDERGREQFAVVQDENAIEVFWFDSISRIEQNHAMMHWTDSKAMWSPLGNYLATFHNPGILLWGGPEWKKLDRFPHPNVQYAQFSPKEKYLVTWNGCVSSAPADEVIVWEVATGKQKRSFPVALNAEGVPPAWPIFKWSHDDRFFGRVGVDMISVYGTPSMGLLDKKSIKIPNVVTFEWSPTDPIIAYWTPEVGNSPARVSILELPSRVELRQKGLYSVAHVQLKWKEDGDFLACRVERYAKNKKIQYVNLELFRMRDKDFPIDILDFKEKELVDAFEWEPKGNRFAVIHGEPANKVVAFYSMESTTNGKLKHLFTVEKNVFNEIRWSPAGTIVALCRLGNPNEAVNGTFEWYNANEQKMIGASDHYCATSFEWDVSGRYAVSYTAFTKYKADNGYILFNVSGKQLSAVNVDVLYQFMWRPRPPFLLTAEEEKAVKKNIKQYRDRYEIDDDELKESKRSGRAARQREVREAWKQYLASREELLKHIKEERSAFENGNPDEESDYEVIEEVKEELIDVEEDIDYKRKMLTSDDERD